MGTYKLVRKEDTPTRNHNDAYSISNYLTKDFNKDFSVVVTELKDGEHNLTKNTSSDRIYYFISGNAIFTIDDKQISVKQDDVLFIEKDTFYSFKGTFKAVLISVPAFTIEHDVDVY
ncbi:hypothetical protein LJC18_02840 [Lachnospiraceae bacterium OttesenSCG-928-E19]|nr:hypothetical protein [Lachnospiraceae bacterium OttesenSCG-928-E19]